MIRTRRALASAAFCFLGLQLLPISRAAAQRTQKPVLHGRHWVAVTGKPLAATAGAMILQKGGNAIDAAAAMLGAVSTMWDVLSWGGETQALIYNPKTQKVIGINALGVAPTGATAEFYKSKGLELSAGVRTARCGDSRNARRTTRYARRVRHDEPGGCPRAGDSDGRRLSDRGTGPPSRLIVNATGSRSGSTRARSSSHIPGEAREAPVAGEIFKQADLAATLRKLVEAERDALKKGKSRKEAIYAAYDRFYKGDIAKELVRGAREEGALFTEADLANWKVHIEEPVSTSYKGIDVYKLTALDAGPDAPAVAQYSGELRRQRDGLQQREVHARFVSVDEPRLCRSRFLLRRFIRAAGRAHQGSPVEGLRQDPCGDDQLGEERP